MCLLITSSESSCECFLMYSVGLLLFLKAYSTLCLISELILLFMLSPSDCFAIMHPSGIGSPVSFSHHSPRSITCFNPYEGYVNLLPWNSHALPRRAGRILFQALRRPLKGCIYHADVRMRGMRFLLSPNLHSMP